ncbi:MAG TPA: AAA family ATPase [Dehalococcoidia bacterium]|nr:AAA family ATPase [Chloroflexota bacterium]HCE75346.1 AAA family ATPase [Dehalococcoidia bacterium]
MNMFDFEASKHLSLGAPLAARMRPTSLDGIVGQTHLTGKDSPLRKSIDAGRIPSFILWGPPGTGKTTIANLITSTSNFHLETISAVTSGVSELRTIISESKSRLGMSGQRTALFIDEIHRFNKAQQDAILPYVENGTVTFIGATTENPSFEIISPLLSRCRVFTLNGLEIKDIVQILAISLDDSEKGLGKKNLKIEDGILENIASLSGGDARWALNTLELAADSAYVQDNDLLINKPLLNEVVATKLLPHDKSGDKHYDTISAFIKSVRSSDPDAAVYWLARLLLAGEDIMFIARRLVILASEDIGLADPRALSMAVSAQQATHFVGMPEARIILSEATIYLASAPKSNSAYTAINAAMSEIKSSGEKAVPLHLRNPVTGLMSQEKYGEGYQYAHDYQGHFVKTKNLPQNLSTENFYSPGTLGYEKYIAERLNKWWHENTTE